MFFGVIEFLVIVIILIYLYNILYPGQKRLQLGDFFV